MAFDKEAYLQSVYSGGEFLPEPPAATPTPPPQKSGLVRRVAGDTAVAALRGAAGIGEMGLGVANLATGGLVGQGTDYIGLTGKEGYIPRFKEITEEWYSPEAQAARQDVAKAEGFLDTLGTIVTRPSALQTMGVETIPTMLAGGAAAKGLQAVTKLSAPVAAAIGEGGAVAGSLAENIRSQDPTNIAGMYAAVPAGVASGLIARGATKLGLGDAETILAGGARATGGAAARAGKGFLGEGGQELLQSGQEQIWQNLATGRPLSEGVAEGMAQGVTLGGIMGAAVNVVAGKPKEVQPDPTDSNEDIALKVDAKLAAVSTPEVREPAQGEMFPSDVAGPPVPPAAPPAAAPGIVESMQQMAAGQEAFDFAPTPESKIEVPPGALEGAKFGNTEQALNQQLTEIGQRLANLGVGYPDAGIPPFSQAKRVYARRAKAAGQKLTEANLRAGHIGNLITARNYLLQLEADARAKYDARAAERTAAMEQRVAQGQEADRWAAIQAQRPVGTTADMFPAEAVAAGRAAQPQAAQAVPPEEYGQAPVQGDLTLVPQQAKETQDALQERRTTQVVSRTGAEGGAAPQGGKGVRQEVQRAGVAAKGKVQEVTPEPLTPEQLWNEEYRAPDEVRYEDLSPELQDKWYSAAESGTATNRDFVRIRDTHMEAVAEATGAAVKPKTKQAVAKAKRAAAAPQAKQDTVKAQKALAKADPATEWDEQYRDPDSKIDMAFKDLSPDLKTIWSDAVANGVASDAEFKRIRNLQRQQTAQADRAKLAAEDDKVGKAVDLDVAAKELRDKADALKQMSEATLDNLDPYDYGYRAYVLYEAEKAMPKKEGIMKGVTDSNSFKLHEEADAVANIDGKPYLAAKQEDPDDDEDEGIEGGVYVWNFQDPSNPSDMLGYTTSTKDKTEAILEFKQHLNKVGKVAVKVVPTHTVGAAKAMIRNILSKWTNAPVIEVSNLADMSEADQAWFANTASKAYFDKGTGKILIASDLHADLSDVKASLFHEALGHYGLHNEFRVELDGMLEQIYKTSPDLAKMADAHIAINPKYTKVGAMEEVLATSQEGGKIPQGVWNKFVALIRKYFRRMGGNLDYTVNDAIAIMRQAHDAVVTGKKTPFTPKEGAKVGKGATAENPATPIGGTMVGLAAKYSDVTHSSAARRTVLGWMSKHHIRETYGTAETGWRGALRKLSAQMDVQDGRMSGLRQESGLVGALFTEFENTVKAAKGWGKNEFYAFMRETSENGVDPRLTLSGNTDTLLAPLEDQRIMVDGKFITYAQAKAQAEAKTKAVEALKAAGKPYEQQERNSKALHRHLAATARNHKELNAKYAGLYTKEQHAKFLEENGKDPAAAVDQKGHYLSQYKDAAQKWQTFGELRSTDGKSRRVAHEMYDTVERHLKSLGAQELYSTVNAWYDVFYNPGSGIPRETSPKKMLAQMKAGDVGGSLGKQFASKVDGTMSRMHQGPYFHNARWGQFFVKYLDKDGELHREHFESQADWQAEVDALTSMAKAGEITEFASGKQADELRSEGGLSAKQLQSMISKAHEQISGDTALTDAEKDAKKSLMTNTLSRAYAELLPETSSRSMRLLRRNVKGASNDMKRAFNKRAEAAHIHIAMGENMPKIMQLTRDLEGEVKALEGGVDKAGDPKEQVIARDITDEMKKRLKDLAEQPDTPVRDMLSSFNHTMYLAANPAYLLSNLLQPYQFVGMLGGTYGMVKSLRMLASKAGVAMDILKEAGNVSMWDPHLDFAKHLAEAEVKGVHKGLTLNQWKMLDELNKNGKLDVTLAREMNTMSQSSTPNEGLNRAHEFVRRAGVGGHYTEAFNRITTALAAYDLATTGGKPMTHAEASSYAERMVDETQLNYSGVNKARMLGKKGVAGANTPLLMAFKSYAIQVLEMHLRTINRAIGKGRAERRAALENSLEGRTAEEVKEALTKFDQQEDVIASDGKKQLAGMMTMTSILAGTMGLPAATALAAVANALGGDDEDVRNKYRNAVASTFGPEMGGMLTNGVLHGAGMDIQGNIGLQDLVPFTRFLADRRELKDKLQGLASDSSGAFVGLTENVISGAAELTDGNVMGGLQKMMPKAISAPLKGAQLAAEGKYRDSKGNLLPMDASAWDALLTGMNIKPSDISDRNTANRYYRSEKYLQGKDKASFQKDYNTARDDKDAEARAEVIAEVRAYNAEHPGAPIKLQSLEQSYRTLQTQIRVAKQSGTGILAGTKQAPELNKYSWGS